MSNQIYFKQQIAIYHLRIKSQSNMLRSFHQMGIIVSYEFICQSLNTNALAVKEVLQDKITEKRFFIFYNNINFYNRITLISYTATYICLINVLKSLVDSNNNWYKYNLNTNQVNKGIMNIVKNKNKA